MKIVVLDGYTADPGDNPWPELGPDVELVPYARSSREQVVERGSSADILVTNKTVLDSALLEQLPAAKFITVMATGYNVVDVAAARSRGVAVANVPSYGTDTVAQYVMALMLELCHHVGAHADSVTAGEWVRSPDWCFWKTPQIELKGLTLGIVGYGRIGQRVAELARAFGMRIVYHSRSQKEVRDASYVSLQELFRTADFVSLHCSLSEANAGFVDSALLRTMKRSAFLINTARGQLIKEQDLATALREGILAGAALDVLSGEPPHPENPLLSAPGCLITPHMAWASLAARQRIVQTTVANLEAFLKGSPINVVN